MNQADFRRELQSFINSCNAEHESGTPDYILAEYLHACLQAFDLAVNQRESARRELEKEPFPNDGYSGSPKLERNR